MIRKQRGILPAVFLAGVAWAGACGGDGGTVTPPTPPPETPNRAPVAVGGLGTMTITAGQTMTVNVSANFNDPDGDALTYTAATSDAAVVAASVTGADVAVEGVAAGTATVTVTARDPGGLTATQTLGVTVQPANHPPEPVGEIEALMLSPGVEIGLDVSSNFTDPDGDTLTYEATSSDSTVATVSMVEAVVTVFAAAVGSATVTVTATDPLGESAIQEFGVTVERVNHAPLLVDSIPPQSVTAGDTVVLVVSANFTDPDGDSLTYEAVSSDTGIAPALASSDTVRITGLEPGSATVAVTATDPQGLSSAQDVQVTVHPNRSPEMADDSIPFPAHDLIVDSAVVLDAAAYFSDPDRDELTYTALTSDEAVAATTVSGSTVTTTAVSAVEDSVLTVTLTVTATDPEGLSFAQEAEVFVSAVDYTPYEGLKLTDDGRINALGQLTLSHTAACIANNLITPFGGFIVHWTEWQQQRGSGWIRVPGTRNEPTADTEPAVCPYNFGDPDVEAGTYRLVGSMSFPDDDGNLILGRYKSENNYTHSN